MLKVSGTSAGTFGPWEDEGLGTGKAGPYKVIFTATVAGTPVKYMAVHQGYPGATMPGGITVNP